MEIDYNNLTAHFDVITRDGKTYFADVSRVLNDEDGAVDPKEYIILEAPKETLNARGVFDSTCSWWAKTENRILISQYFKYKYN